MRHRSVARDTVPPPDWVAESITLSHSLIDHGLRAGLDAMRHTAGLGIDPWAGHDVLELALYRALTSGLPRSATIGEVADRMTALVQEEVTRG